jgi:hypothetical protein
VNPPLLLVRNAGYDLTPVDGWVICGLNDYALAILDESAKIRRKIEPNNFEARVVF